MEFVEFIRATTERVQWHRRSWECGKASPDMEAMKLAPCASAGLDENASVSRSYCLQVKKLGQKPSCLCAVMLSNTAKSSGIKPEVAITIPKRCNLANRPVGYNLYIALKSEGQLLGAGVWAGSSS
ncbi:hypothetical protein LguiA_023726 [Lonicera macranthoides]